MTDFATASGAATAADRATPSRLSPGLSLPLALGLMAYLLGLVSTTARLDDPDTMLHVVIGRWVMAHGAVPHVDVFTHSVPGRAWVAHEWLGGVVSALVYGALGWHGLVAMASLGLGLAVAFFARALLRHYGPPQTIIIACAAWFVVTPHWLARPHILALPLLVLWTALLVRAREENRAPPAWTALLMTLWVNLHGTFIVGIGFMGLLAVEAVLLAEGEAQRLRAAKDWALFALAAVAASLVTPYGIEAYLLPLRLLDMKFALSMLVEWKSIDFQKLSTLELWLLLFLGAALVTGIRLPPTRVLLLLLLFVMALQHARNGDLIAFMAPLLAGPAAGAQLRRSRLGSGDGLERLARTSDMRGAWLAAALAIAGEAAAVAFPVTPVEKYAPAAAVEAAEAAGVAGPVLNDYNYGDYLMLNGIKTFVDGRADMFGDPFLKRYYDAVHGTSDGLPALLADYGIAWTIFPVGERAVSLMDRMPGWHRLYADSLAVVHVRDEAGR